MAFSLAEVVIALAIAALGFISLLGLLPQGLEMARKAADTGAQLRIFQMLSAELNSTPWERITWTQHNGPKRYFDDQGIEIQANQVNSPNAMLSYVVSVYVPTQALDVRLPVSSGGGATDESFIRRVRVCIATSSNPNHDFNKERDPNVREFPTLLAKMSK